MPCTCHATWHTTCHAAYHATCCGTIHATCGAAYHATCHATYPATCHAAYHAACTCHAACRIATCHTACHAACHAACWRSQQAIQPAQASAAALLAYTQPVWGLTQTVANALPTAWPAMVDSCPMPWLTLLSCEDIHADSAFLDQHRFFMTNNAFFFIADAAVLGGYRTARSHWSSRSLATPLHSPSACRVAASRVAASRVAAS